MPFFFMNVSVTAKHYFSKLNYTSIKIIDLSCELIKRID